jgi:hypothetical protein
MLGSLHGTIPGADVSAHADFGEMLGFTDTIFGQTPGRRWATLGRHDLPAVARGPVS